MEAMRLRYHAVISGTDQRGLTGTGLDDEIGTLVTGDMNVRDWSCLETPVGSGADKPA